MNIFGVRVTATVAHERAIDVVFAIDPRAPEPETESTRHCRFRPSGVGREMLGRIAPRGVPNLARGCESAKCSGSGEKQCRKTRSREIDEIAKPRRRPAEIHKARRTMSHHAVGCVDRFIKHRAGEAAKSQPEGWRDGTIGEILGEAFNRGA